MIVRFQYHSGNRRLDVAEFEFAVGRRVFGVDELRGRTDRDEVDLAFPLTVPSFGKWPRISFRAK